MTGLGLRYCQQHLQEPLMLVSTGLGTYWRCEHASGCAYTENAQKRSTKVIAVNGERLITARKFGHRSARTPGGSSVEKAAVENEERNQHEAEADYHR